MTSSVRPTVSLKDCIADALARANTSEKNVALVAPLFMANAEQVEAAVRVYFTERETERVEALAQLLPEGIKPSWILQGLRAADQIIWGPDE